MSTETTFNRFGRFAMLNQDVLQKTTLVYVSQDKAEPGFGIYTTDADICDALDNICGVHQSEDSPVGDGQIYFGSLSGLAELIVVLAAIIADSRPVDETPEEEFYFGVE